MTDIHILYAAAFLAGIVGGAYAALVLLSRWAGR